MCHVTSAAQSLYTHSHVDVVLMCQAAHAGSETTVYDLKTTIFQFQWKSSFHQHNVKMTVSLTKGVTVTSAGQNWTSLKMLIPIRVQFPKITSMQHN